MATQTTPGGNIYDPLNGVKQDEQTALNRDTRDLELAKRTARQLLENTEFSDQITGPAGPAPDIYAGTTTQVDAGTPASVDIVETGEGVYRADFTIPKGADGDGTGMDDASVASHINTVGSSTQTALNAQSVQVATQVGADRVAVSVVDYGAKGDGVTDDTAAIKAAVAAVQTGFFQGLVGGRVILPAGEYVISDTILLNKFAGVIEGAGIGNTRWSGKMGETTTLRWIGPTTKPMIRLSDHRHVQLRDFRMEGNNNTPPTYGIESYNDATMMQGFGSNLHISNVYIGRYVWTEEGLSTGKIQRGIGWTGANGNNDQWHISDSFIIGCDIGVHVPNSQSIWGQIDNTTIWECAAGVDTNASITANNIRFQLCDTDWLIRSSAQVNVFGGYSENSGLLAHCTSSMGRFIQYGGVWTLHDKLGTGVFIRHDDATVDGGIMLHEIKIDTTVSPHPKIRTRSVVSSLRAGRLTMRDCSTAMKLSDFDVSTIGGGASNGRIRVNITSGELDIQNYLMKEGDTLTSIPTNHTGKGGPNGVITADVGSMYRRLDGAAGLALYIKESGNGTNTGWTAFKTAP